MMVAGQVSVAGTGQALNVGHASVNFGVQWCEPHPRITTRPPTTVWSCASVKARNVSFFSDNFLSDRPNTKHLLADSQPKKEGTEIHPDFSDVYKVKTVNALADGSRLNDSAKYLFFFRDRLLLDVAFTHPPTTAPAFRSGWNRIAPNDSRRLTRSARSVMPGRNRNGLPLRACGSGSCSRTRTV